MKTSTCKYIFFFGLFAVLVACSTKKNSFINRNYHAVTTEYNVLYNGNIALLAGINDVKTNYKDDFWTLLPIERMQPTDEKMNPGDKKNPNFERAESKATKAIQKHSMNIAGSEKNPQMDEAHLLLGKTRYYDNRFIPALEAFNYILYKYPQSDKIYEAKVWREKTYIRLENDGLAIKNLKALLHDNKLEGQVYADANAILAQGYINIEAPDSAAVVLKKAIETTRENEEKARYRFILGQLYEKMKYPDSAFATFQSVIDMKRKSPRRYVIQAHAEQAKQFDFQKGDTLAFMEKYNNLLEDRENRPFLDVLNHQIALFYDKQNNDKQAKKYYNKSLRASTADRYLTASNHRNLAEINFKNAKYQTAGLYYDSTMVYLNNRTREYKSIKKKRENLADVIKYEAIAQNNDSILKIVALPEAERKSYFENYIVSLRKREEEERIRQEKQKQLAMSQNQTASADPVFMNNMDNAPTRRNSPADAKSLGGKDSQMSKADMYKSGALGNRNGATGGAGGSTFYFYNTATVSYGILEFKKKWGNRALVENWRWSSSAKKVKNDTSDKEGDEENAAADDAADKDAKEEIADPRYTPEFYLKQLPTSQVVLDSLAKDRNFAYYQLGLIYKEKFKEYQRAATRLEQLLANNPEERLILPAKYNLYKIYEIIDPAKAAVVKQQILSQYPDSRYAQIILNPSSNVTVTESPEAVYQRLYKQYEKGALREVLSQTETYIENYTGEEIVPKLELLKANVTGRIKGLAEYKKALNFVALNYPNSTEGKEAEALLKTNIPPLEKLSFNQKPESSWKIIFIFDNPADPKIKGLTDKITKFIKDGMNNQITWSQDVYTMNEDFIVLHGFNSRIAALDAVNILKDFKTYKVAEMPYIISSENYKVVQIKKNFTEFLALK